MLQIKRILDKKKKERSIIFVSHIFLSNRYLFSSARSARRNAFTLSPKVTDNAVRLPTKLQCADKYLQSSQ